MARWFRSHASKLNDPKVHRLTDRQYRAWDSFLCMAAEHEGRLPLLPDAAFLLRKPEDETGLLIRELIDLGFLVRGRRGIEPYKWNKWQYKSDVSTERVKRFRQRSETVSETPSESETEAETEQTVAKATGRARKELSDAKPKPHRIPTDWQPSQAGIDYARDRGLDPGETAAAFKDYWDANSGPTSRKLDWDAAFRTWCRRDSARPVGVSAVRAVQPARGNDPFYEQLASIAARDRDGPTDAH